jgi:hypothetical protein
MKSTDTLKRGPVAPTGATETATQTQAAKQVNVSRRSVQRARVVHDKGIPELQALVVAGKVSLNAASAAAGADFGHWGSTR